MGKRRPFGFIAALGLALLGAAWGCAADSAADASASPAFGGSSGSSGSGAVNGGGAAAGTGGVPIIPPEQEVEAEFELPHAGEHYVYAANPEADSVAVIDATTLAIHSVEAGDEPRFLQTLAGMDKAIVLNVSSEDASVITTLDGQSTAVSVGVHGGANTIAVAPDGNHAVVYFDAAKKTAGTPAGSFQDLTVITLVGGTPRKADMTVGFRPSAVFFADDSSKAFVVTENGVSVLDFAAIDRDGGGIAPPVPVSANVDARALDVSITSSGQYALGRNENDASLRLVDLEQRTTAVLDLTGYVLVPPDGAAGASGAAGADPGTTPPPQAERGAITDVDLSPASDFALAVIRSSSTLLQIPIPGGFDDPSQIVARRIEGNLVGSVTLSGDSRFALLYTTALDDVERLTIVDLQTDATPLTIDTKKAISAVAIAPDHRNALLVHKKLPGDPNAAELDPELVIDYSHGYSLVQLESGFAKLALTAAEVGSFTAVPDGSAMFLLFNSDTVHEVQRAGLTDFHVTSFELGSPPVSVGAVPGSSKVFVGQEHPDGRITFIDWTTFDVKSVTGFELNSKIRE